MKTVQPLFFILFVTTVFHTAVSQAGSVGSVVPTNPDTTQHYLFYMHGGYVEKRGADGDYRYNDILQALSEQNLNVIGEARGPTRLSDYALKIKTQVQSLISAGVPADHITVAGHSKGGMLTLYAAAAIDNPEVRYAIFAACGLPNTRFQKPYQRFVRSTAENLKGKFLVAWEASDDVAKDCDKAFRKARVSAHNVELTTGGGHRLFYKPDPAWIDMLAGFAQR